MECLTLADALAKALADRDRINASSEPVVQTLDSDPEDVQASQAAAQGGL